MILLYKLTAVIPDYSEDPSVHLRSASLLHLVAYFQIDPDLSDLKGLSLELKPEQHILYL